MPISAPENPRSKQNKNEYIMVIMNYHNVHNRQSTEGTHLCSLCHSRWKPYTSLPSFKGLTVQATICFWLWVLCITVDDKVVEAVWHVMLVPTGQCHIYFPREKLPPPCSAVSRQNPVTSCKINNKTGFLLHCRLCNIKKCILLQGNYRHISLNIGYEYYYLYITKSNLTGQR